MTDKTIVRAVTALALTTVLWGISFPLVRMSNKLIEEHFRVIQDGTRSVPTTFDQEFAAASASIALRFGLACAILAILLPGTLRRMTAGQWLMGATAGLVCSLGLFLQVLALNEIPASRSGFLTSLSVVFTPLLMIAITRRIPPLSVFLSVACALLGVAILTEVCRLDGSFGVALADNARENVGVGDLLTLLAAMIFAGQIILIDIFSRRMPPALLTPGMFAAMFLAGLAVFTMHHWVRSPTVPTVAWAELAAAPGFMLLTIVICVVCTLAPYHLMNKYQGALSPTHAAVIYTAEPIFATLGAMWLPGWLSTMLGIAYPSEEMTWALVAGGGLVLAANLLGFRSSQPKPA